MQGVICISKKVVALVLVMLVVICFSSVNAFATGVNIEIITDPSVTQQGSQYVPPSGSQYSGTGNVQQGTQQSQNGQNGAIQNTLQQIANGEDHASELLGTDNFRPQQVDNSWLDPIINAVAWLSSALCGIFGAFTLVKMLVDVICILVPIFATLLDSLKVSWLYSDVCAALIGKSGTEGMKEGESRSLPDVGSAAQGTISSKLVYWFRESIFTAIIAGAVLVGIATGVVPELINFCINFIINGLMWIMRTIKGA